MTEVPLAAPTACEELRQRFLWECARPSSIHQHLTVMRDTASGCKSIIELGVGEGISTTAWLLVQPDELLLVDLAYQPHVWPDFLPLDRWCGKTKVTYWIADSRIVELPETDLLFIDTSHTYHQLKEELRCHGNKARRHIVLHDTTTFGEVGETGHAPGLWRAVEEFLADNPHWWLKHRHTHNNGLTILQRGA